MNCTTNNPAARRYMRRFAVTMLLYVLFLVLAVWVFVHRHPTGVLAYALAVLPALPAIGLLAVFGLYLAEEKDDFQRFIGVQAMLWGIGGTLAVTTIWGFLENFVHIRHLDLILVFPIFWAFFGISLPILLARYK
ncbi:MAG: hypothetical protein ABSC48_00615 [Terracidiphilus sp.]|jgi:hypothetical protein